MPVTPRFLLDTNILSDLIRNPGGGIAIRIAEVGEASVCTSIVVAAELRFGAAKKGAARLTERVEALLEAVEVVPFEAPADDIYGGLRAELERAGRVIGANDMLIAAHALSLDCVLVTDNEKEFGRIEGLKLDNWLQRPVPA